MIARGTPYRVMIILSPFATRAKRLGNLTLKLDVLTDFIWSLNLAIHCSAGVLIRQPKDW